MSKLCPLTGEKILYLECLECERKICREIEKNPEKGDNKDNAKKES